MSLLLILSILSPLVPLLVGYHRKLPLLWYYTLVCLFFDLLITILRRGLHLSYKWPANVFILAEFLLLSFVYRRQIFRNDKVFYLFVVLCSIGFIIQAMANSVFIVNSVGSSIFMFIYLIYGLVGLYTILQKQEIMFLERSWFFWLNVALIIYASGNFLVLLFRDYMITVDEQLYLKLWKNIFLMLNIIKNIIIAIALYHHKKQTHRQDE